jgi:acetyl/propionyl-CoA carboxylase alpha subunit
VFKRVLIANRGEIACRIIRSCRALGIETIAIHSEADAGALHVRMADGAYGVGPAAVAASYLDRERVVDVAVEAGADAVHPGYGLLSEDPVFAALCAERGLTFVGPTPESMRLIGHKLPARAQAAAVAIPVVPGTEGPVNADDVGDAARAIGYPLILKANAGGGGIGMSIVASPDELEATLRRTSSSAGRYFGDESVYVERYLPGARHVEVQVLGTEAGAVHLYHRDCSIQRRHQKVIEEAPAPGLEEELSARLTSAATRLADSIGYRNAGTIEFLVAGGELYFLEVNARLQVEHPVTEAVTGTDLVETQLRLAAGERIPWSPEGIAVDGHSIECRIYAEHPVTGRPSPGRIETLKWPQGAAIRIDAGYEEGDVVSPHYDPLIAKLISHGRDRTEAIDSLHAALEETSIGGIRTNISAIQAVLADSQFREGLYDTETLPRVLKQLE